LATNSKDFKIKNGLIVEGATATVNGDNVITEASSISNLSDVDTTGATDSQALVYDEASSTWIPGEGGGGASYTVSETAPVAPEVGDVWFNSTNGKSYIYYTDVDSSQWVEVSGAEGATGTVATLGDIPDVTLTGAQDGNALVYDAILEAWVPGEGGGKFAVSDTAPAAPENGDTWFKSDTGKTYIYYEDYDNGQWVEIASNTTGYLDIGQLNDVTIVSPTTGQALTYDGSGWVNATPASTIDSLSGTDGQFLIHNGTEWVASALASSNMPTGSILQVAQATKVDVVSTTSTSFIDTTGMTVDITPRSTSSKIMVMVQLSHSNSSGSTEHSFNLVRNSTNLLQSTGGSTSNSTMSPATIPTTVNIINSAIMFLDSPSTTSTVTYKMQWRTGAGTLYLNRRGVSGEFGSTSTITLMEVAG
jgi:hypothetical protein